MVVAENMMKSLHKHKATKSGDRIEFRISHLKALQVPKGWDKLFVSVISVENGKTIAKSSKVPVRNGSCQWSDTFSESIWVSRDNSSKEIDDYLLKLIVAMGSSRSGILGEATVSLTSYVSSEAAIPLSIPLNKCNHGTVLHVTVQCLTPRTRLRDQESSKTNSHLKAMNENNNDVVVKSNGSDCSYVQSVESSSIDDVDSILSPGEVETRATSFSGSVSNCSYNSAEGSTGRENFSPCISDGQSPTGGQDSTSSQKSVSHHDYPVNNSSQSNHSSFKSQNMQDIGASSPKMNNVSNNRLEAAEDTSEELRAEAKMWEMNARKLMGDLDMLRTEFSDQSKRLAGLEMDLSAANVERDSLKKEVEQLKLSPEDPIVRQKALEDSLSQGECIPEIENALIDELKFQKESNANLSLQLKKSQEANVELVSVLQELEETIQQQKIEIENLSSLPSKLSDLEKSFQLSIEGNRSLMQQLEQLEESKRNLLNKVQELEEALEDKMRDIELAKISNSKALSDIETEYESKLSAKKEEILSLKARLFESLPESCNAENMSRNVCDADLLREIEVLKEKVQELEMDCNELTDENLELLFKLKEAKNNSKDGGASEDLLSNKPKDQSFATFESEISRSQAAGLQEKIMEMQSEMDSLIEDLKQKLKATQFHWAEAQEECEYLRGENQQLQITIDNLAKECNSFKKLNGDLRQQKLELEEYCSLMGDRLKESDERFADCSERVELLEKKLALMLEDIASKEKHLTSNLDGFLDENRKHVEQGQSLLNQIQMEKMVEIKNLELEIENLSMKLSATNDEKERIASNALLEVSSLHADKAKMESALEEAQSKVVLSKTEVNMMQTQYEQKLKDLRTELADSKIKMEMLMAEHEKLLKLVEDYKSRELKFKSTINALEMKLTVAEYERQQFIEESGNLKVKLQQTHQFENEIMALKNELKASNSEKERLEASLCLTSELCEDLKAEKTSFDRKILTLEKAASELEDCKRTRASLEERLIQTENDLKARETRCVQDTELSHIKRINSQHQQTIQLLEQEKAECQRKAQALEEELKLIKEQKRNQVSKLNRKCVPVHDDLKASKNPVVKNTNNQHRSNRKKPSLKNDREIMKDQHDPYYNNKHQNEVETEHGLLDESVHAVEVDPVPKTQLLETELANAKEANNIYNVQPNSLKLFYISSIMIMCSWYESKDPVFTWSPSQGRNNQANGPVNSMAEGEVVTKERFEHTKSMLEAELRDIQERYFHMSLKYAEVESEREELVMKLKAAKNKKGWLL
ncbi:NT-type C2 domain [Sesbania bispinosa]|nr:NT-type C2 domain [Sesbania bispinosa]